MADDPFVQVIEDFLLPLFPGAVIDPSRQPSPANSKQLVSLIRPNQIALRAESSESRRILISRSQPFSKEERQLTTLFIKDYHRISESLDDFKDELSAIALKSSIATFLAVEQHERVFSAISLFESLSGRTYEGSNLSLALGLVDEEAGSTLSIDEYYHNDFGLVLANGFNTIVKADFNGKIIGHEYLGDMTNNSFAPWAYNPIANWSTQGIAFVLNRNNEILIFKDGKLQFSKRRLTWQYYSHDKAVTILAAGNRKSWSQELRQKIYESVLDVSFARTGGLITLAKQSEDSNARRTLAQGDLPGSGITPKSRYVEFLKNTVTFPELHRTIRQELVAIDGATVLDHKGAFINCGAIVTEVFPSPDGGARSAAARALAEYGIALKISVDGQITGYARKGKQIEKYFVYA